MKIILLYNEYSTCYWKIIVVGSTVECQLVSSFKMISDLFSVGTASHSGMHDFIICLYDYQAACWMAFINYNLKGMDD